MGITIQIAQLVLCLSILVVLHEWGHFITARMFKMRVEKFYLFFNPYFSIIKKKIGDTEYGLGWLPLGGYVKISGMIDESMDKEQMKKAPEPWEFRAKPAWQRLIVMLGGVTVNAILAVIIFSGMFWNYGEEYMLASDMPNGIVADSLAQDAGLKTGDKILSIDGKDSLSYPKDVIISILFGEKMEVEREGKVVELPIAKLLKKGMIKNSGSLPIIPRVPSVVGGIIKEEGYFAQNSDLKEGDVITAIDGNTIVSFDEIANWAAQKKGEKIKVDYTREDIQKSTTVEVNLEGKLGIGSIYQNPILLEKYIPTHKNEYGLLSSLSKGYDKTINTLVMQVKQFQLIFDTELEAYKQVGSFISITKMFSPTWDWVSFWTLTGVLSIWLAFINLLPIPGLDGGHAVFAIYEMVSGRKPGDKFMEIVQTIGMVFLLSLMVIIVGWDIIKNFFI